MTAFNTYMKFKISMDFFNYLYSYDVFKFACMEDYFGR